MKGNGDERKGCCCLHGRSGENKQCRGNFRYLTFMDLNCLIVPQFFPSSGSSLPYPGKLLCLGFQPGGSVWSSQSVSKLWWVEQSHGSGWANKVFSRAFLIGIMEGDSVLLWRHKRKVCALSRSGILGASNCRKQCWHAQMGDSVGLPCAQMGWQCVAALPKYPTSTMVSWLVRRGGSQLPHRKEI
jgi:hypothetical protein